MLGSTQQLARILFEKLELTPGRKGRPATRPTRACSLDPVTSTTIVESIEEWRELTKLSTRISAAAAADSATTAGCTRTSTSGRRDRPPLDVEPEPAGDPDPHRARARDPLAFVAEHGSRCLGRLLAVELRILAHVSGEPTLREAFARGEDIHTATGARCSARTRRR
jgi:DNA polymerase-1